MMVGDKGNLGLRWWLVRHHDEFHGWSGLRGMSKATGLSDLATGPV
jgi:hypothetical protein